MREFLTAVLLFTLCCPSSAAVDGLDIPADFCPGGTGQCSSLVQVQDNHTGFGDNQPGTGDFVAGSELAARGVDVGARVEIHRLLAGVANDGCATLMVTSDVEEAVKALDTLPPPPGRGARDILAVPGGNILLIDESYNANPASMRASLATPGTVSRAKFPRRIVVLGDMLELGPSAAELHRGLIEAVVAAGVDQLFACGAHMKGLYDAASAVIKGGYAETADGLKGPLTEALKAGDAVMIKGSNGMKLGPLAAHLRTILTAEAT